MSEQDFREGLRAALADEPALAFDPEAVISRARREASRRRALVGAGAATAAVAVAAVAVPTVLGSPRGSVGAGGPKPAWPCATQSGWAKPAPPSPTRSLATPGDSPKPTVPPSKTFAPPVKIVPKEESPLAESTPPCPGLSESPKPTSDIAWPPADVKPVPYTAEQLRQRGVEMQAHLRTRFPTVVPGATGVEPGVFGGEAAGEITDGQTYLEAFTSFTLNGTRSAVDIYTTAPGAEEELAPCSNCKIDQRADGSIVMITNERLDGSDGMVVSVAHYRSNGTVVRVAGYNYDPTSRTQVRYLPEVTVTVEQLTALATDPALGL